MLNSKGDIQSMFYVIVVLGVIAFILFFFSHFFYQLYGELDDYLGENVEYNNTEAQQAIESIMTVEQSVWDYAFLALAIGYVLLIALFSFTQQTNPVFYWISVVLSVIGLFLGVVVGYVWQGLAAEPELADTVARFPIMNTLLGSYYPTFVVFIIVLGLILLYAKPQGGGQ